MEATGYLRQNLVIGLPYGAGKAFGSFADYVKARKIDFSWKITPCFISGDVVIHEGMRI